MPKYKNVTVANFDIRDGKGLCTIMRGTKKLTRAGCNGIQMGAMAIKGALVTRPPAGSGFTFGKNVTCEINTEGSPFGFLRCKKGGK